MSDFLNQLRRFEQSINKDSSFQQAILTNAANDANVHRNLVGKIVLDPSKDPDPYSLHSIPLSTRLIEMGWK